MLSPISFFVATQIIFLLIVAPSNCVLAGEYFNSHALEIGNPNQKTSDLSAFSQSNSQLPGTYRVSIILNGEEIDTRDISFKLNKSNKLQPELTLNDLANMGVNVEASPRANNYPRNKPVENIGDFIPLSTTDLNFNKLRLIISIPQAWLNNQAQGSIDPKQWDQGVTALLLNYNMTGSNTKYIDNGSNSDSYYTNLQSGLNFGAWRLRNYSSYIHDSDSGDNFDSINTYVQRDIQLLKSQLTIGDSYTPSDMFDSVQFRGAQIASNDNMLPDSLRGFAPVIRGIARSNAKVTVKQNGYVIYQSYVPPGAFNITDLFPTSSSGDLNVTITEADGSERSFAQAFSAVPIMQRESRLKYSATAGRYRSSNNSADEPNFGQGSIIYGLPNAMTVYSGFLGADNYKSLVVGFGIGMGSIGSISIDGTQADATLHDNNKKHDGQSYRLQYAKDIQATATTFTLAAYRYSTEGFYTFQESNDLRTNGDDDSDNWDVNHNKRQKLQLDVNQNLSEYGSMFISGYQQDYWNELGYERSFSSGYNGSFNGVNYSFTYTYSKNAGSGNEADQQFAFNIQVPLNRWLSSSYASYNITTDKHGKTNQLFGINGTTFPDNNLSYSVQESYGNHGQNDSGSINGDYKGTYGEVNAGYNYNNDSKQLNYGLQGGIIVHPHGLTFSQPLGSAVAIVRAPGANNTKIQNNTGVYTDWRGYAIVPFVNPYKNNRIAIDTTTLNDDVDIDVATKNVVPTEGAVVMADFNTRIGKRMLMAITYNGEPVPFGAIASLQDNSGTGIVGDNGEVYLTGVPESGILHIKWGNDISQRCSVNFNNEKVAGDSLKPGSLYNYTGICK
ncbi:fimbrial biogenesis outer membrane usher protein [Lelliottia nimipressuralis]|uniref:Fimbrial biogenesis outer membrane usher protein n=1 Tax=Lelliottia nimipressuralis TaxID=69220 RepID=A0ABD4KFF7_9ENTR|nr:fimbrial biogenesis outer membrane usher protein [Lelliottia nimipressuralis]